MKVKKFFADNKFAFLFFVAMLGCGLATVNWKDFNDGVSDAAYAFYLADFNIGFCSKHFIGALVGLFKPTFDDTWLKGLIYTVVVIACAFTAAMFAKTFKAIEAENQKYLVFTAAVFAALPWGFSFFFQYLGFFDIYWYLLTLVAIVCLNNKYAKWAIPVICFLCVGVHFVYFSTFFPFLFILLVYNIINGENKRSDIALLVVSLVVTFVWTVYFMVFATSAIQMTADETFAYMNSRFNLPLDRVYYEGYIYGVYDGVQISTFSHALQTFLDVNFSNNLTFNNLGKATVYIVALFSFFNYLWFSAMKQSKTKADKSVFILCMLLSCLLLPLLVLSTDYERWISAIAIMEFMLVAYFIYRKDETVTGLFAKTCSALLSQPLALAAVALVILL